MSESVWEKPVISKMSVQFVQDGNTLGTTEETEIINIEVEYQMPGEGPFFVIKTDGWSIDEPLDMEKLLNLVKEAEYHIRTETSDGKEL